MNATKIEINATPPPLRCRMGWHEWIREPDERDEFTTTRRWWCARCGAQDGITIGPGYKFKTRTMENPHERTN